MLSCLGKQVTALQLPPVFSLRIKFSHFPIRDFRLWAGSINKQTHSVPFFKITFTEFDKNEILSASKIESEDKAIIC